MEETIDTSGFYKKIEDGTWQYARYEVVAPNYTLSCHRYEEIGEAENKDGWKFHNEAPIEYIEWKEFLNNKLKEDETIL